MGAQKKIREDIISNNNYKMLTRAYQEHAVGQINFARYSVLNSRDFADDLSDIFVNVKSSYNNNFFSKKTKNIVKKNGKEAWILISANKKLYGDLLIRVCRLFEARVKESDPKKVDLIIIGKQGKKFFDELHLNRTYKYVELSEFNVSMDFLKDINKDLIYYEDVIIFYGKFKSLVTQIPVEASISGGKTGSGASAVAPQDPNSPITENAPTQEAQKIVANSPLSAASALLGKKQNKKSFLFEPKIEEILAFFENQILSLLLSQTVQEAQLARFASRINAMETAQDNIEKQITRLKREEKKTKNIEMNKKQLGLLAGRRLWAVR